MPIYMLHFDCSAAHAKADANLLTADACAISDTLEQAESLGRQAIGEHDYDVGSLIAYSQVEKSEVAGLSEYETILYLKALKHKPTVAVMFSS